MNLVSNAKFSNEGCSLYSSPFQFIFPCMKNTRSVVFLNFKSILWALTVCPLILLCSQCRNKEAAAKNGQEEAIRDLIRDEEAVLEVTALTKLLTSSIKNMIIIGPESRSLFSDKIEISDLFDSGAEEVVDAALGISQVEWQAGEAKGLSLAEAEKVGVWNALLGTFDEVSHASFGFISGKSDDGKLLQSVLKFAAKGVDRNSKQISLEGKVAVDWVKSGDSWKITKWDTKGMTLTRRKKLMFRNRMPELFSSSNHQLATRSWHEDKLTEFIQKDETKLPKGEYGPYFQPESGYQHPAVSVVDINGDGWDDLFVTSLWAPCQLWVNQGGKYFTEQAGAYGLNVLACCTSAIFADLDNDGDSDLILGRSLERSQLLWNEGGYYVVSPVEFPYLVTSVSTADCNNDGLLDIYLCTYGPSGTAAKSNPAWIRKFLPEGEHSSIYEALAGGHPYFDQAGPRNYLLVNRGGRRFERAPTHPAIDQYHNSYQGSWADYDKDGDVDLYICNDFAPDSLLRNDGVSENGVPRFTDVSEGLSGDTMKGFGMGASWGDYDNDQQQDLFVTNMYSKAGHRVLSRFDNVDDRLHFSARGNLLFSQDAGKFNQLAGESDAFPVDQGGWAFGGQFIDVDNDAWLDIYVPNGFYTAPKVVASEVDL